MAARNGFSLDLLWFYQQSADMMLTLIHAVNRTLSGLTRYYYA